MRTRRERRKTKYISSLNITYNSIPSRTKTVPETEYYQSINYFGEKILKVPIAQLFSCHIILVPRAYDPSGLPQESRALGATISGMRHICRLRETGWAEFGYFLCYSKWLLPELSIPAAGQKDRRLGGRECCHIHTLPRPCRFLVKDGC